MFFKTLGLTLAADPRLSPLRSRIACCPLSPVDLNSSFKQHQNVSPPQRTPESLPLADSGPLPSDVAVLPSHLQPSAGSPASRPSSGNSTRSPFPQQNHFRSKPQHPRNSRFQPEEGWLGSVRKREVGACFASSLCPRDSRKSSDISYSLGSSLNALAVTTQWTPRCELRRLGGSVCRGSGQLPRNADRAFCGRVPTPRGRRRGSCLLRGLSAGVAAAPEQVELGVALSLTYLKVKLGRQGSRLRRPFPSWSS